jgi:hypothetical protein
MCFGWSGAVPVGSGAIGTEFVYLSLINAETAPASQGGTIYFLLY